MNKTLIISITILGIALASCSSVESLPGFAQLAADGKVPLEYIAMTKSSYMDSTAYEVSLKNSTSDSIISFDYSMVLFDDDDKFVSYEDKNFGGNNVTAPGEQFSILAKMENDAPRIRFLLKSISWKETLSGGLFKWENPAYDETLRQFRLKGIQ